MRSNIMFKSISLCEGGSLTRIFLVIKSWLIEARCALKSVSGRSVSAPIRDHFSSCGQPSSEISSACHFSHVLHVPSPIRGQYPGHVITLSQWEVSILSHVPSPDTQTPPHGELPLQMKLTGSLAIRALMFSVGRLLIFRESKFTSFNHLNISKSNWLNIIGLIWHLN